MGGGGGDRGKEETAHLKTTKRFRQNEKAPA